MTDIVDPASLRPHCCDGTCGQHVRPCADGCCRDIHPVDPATLRPGDVVDASIRCTVIAVGPKHVETNRGTYCAEYDEGLGRTWHLVSRAEPERGSVWRSPGGGEYFYEPDDRWPGQTWISAKYGDRYPIPLADMTFVRPAAVR